MAVRLGHRLGHALGRNLGLPQRGGTPAPIALEAIAWWEADSDYMALDGSNNVLSWTDRIGEHVLSQAVSARQPLFSVDHIAFAGDDLFGSILSEMNSFPFTVYAKIRWTANNPSGFGTPWCVTQAASALSTARAYIQNTGTNWFAQAYNGTANATPQVSGGATQGSDQWCYAEYASASSRGTRIQGSSESRDDTTVVNWPESKDTLALGALFQGGSVLQQYHGRIYDYVVFDRVLSAPEHAQMQGYLS